MEQLIAGDVKEIIAAGCCGALVEDTEGSFLYLSVILSRKSGSFSGKLYKKGREGENHVSYNNLQK